MDQLEVLKDVLKNQIEASIMSKLDVNFDELYQTVTSECEKRNADINSQISDLKEAKKQQNEQLSEDVDRL